jgi:hypothetical protein
MYIYSITCISILNILERTSYSYMCMRKSRYKDPRLCSYTKIRVISKIVLNDINNISAVYLNHLCSSDDALVTATHRLQKDKTGISS